MINIIELLGITYKEDIISNMLIALINESQNFRKGFFSRLMGIDNIEEYSVNAQVRIGTSVGIPDIIITADKETDSFLIIIENKLKAEEGTNQTLRYSEEACISDILANPRIIIKNHRPQLKFFYLTLIPEQMPTGESFVNITYKDLVEASDWVIEDAMLHRIYSDFLILLKDFYRNLEVKEEDKLIELLHEDIDPEKMFIRFRNIVRGIELPEDFREFDVKKLAGRGRNSFIIQISKKGWRGDGRIFIKDNIKHLEKDCYDIHFEGYFDLTNKKLALPLHYETYPYVPKKDLERDFQAEEYNLYLTKREEVKNLIHQELSRTDMKNIKLSNGSNQIAALKLLIDENTTVGAFRELVKDNILRVSKAVDSALVKA